MPEQHGGSSAQQGSADGHFRPSPPQLALPNGGGVIRGIGEQFAANPVTGTGALSVPIFPSPGRSGFGPQLSLSYDSGAGNSPFGFGWHLALPSITRKTDKGLPQYRDGEESDVFILSGAEDLVPVLLNGGGQWQCETSERTVDGVAYSIQRYRPRIEGLLARLERWTKQADPGETCWRSISKDNITIWYGKTAESRIVDPNDPTCIFGWLICESYDDKGNALLYKYKEENTEGVDLRQAHERNRTAQTRAVNRYVKRIKYGNRRPYFPILAADQPPTPLPADLNPFFNPIHYTRDHIPAILGEIDLGRPVPLGLIATRNLLELGTNHQIVAYGYEINTQGNSLTLFCYDNNVPDMPVTLITNPSYPASITYSTGQKWIGFFKEEYSAKRPTYLDLGLADGLDLTLTDASQALSLPLRFRLGAVPSTVPFTVQRQDVGAPLTATCTVKNFGIFPAHLAQFSLPVLGPAEEHDTLLGSLARTTVQSGEQVVVSRTAPSFATTPGAYTIRAQYTNARGQVIDLPELTTGTHHQARVTVVPAGTRLHAVPVAHTA
jgi:hypothetical protein